MKKMNNKGFSLVELIIVIAIMAILAGALAPALIKYIEKSRNSTDKSTAKSIQTAIETTLTDEDAYAEVSSTIGSGNSASYNVCNATQWATFSNTFNGATSAFQTELNSQIASSKVVVKSKKNITGYLITISIGTNTSADDVTVVAQ